MTASSEATTLRMRLAVFAAFTAAYFLSYFFRSSNAIIAPDLQRDLALGANELGFMTGAYFLAFAAVQIPLGFALDAWGARWVTAGGLLIAAAGGLIFARAEGYQALVIGRLLVGAGMGSVLMGAMKSFSRHFSGDAYRTATSALVGIGSLGAVAAASPLAHLTQVLGWRGSFVAAAACVAVAALFVAMADVGGVGSRTSQASLGDGGADSYTVLRDGRLWALTALNAFMAGTLFSVQGLWAGPLLFDTRGFGAIEVGRYLTVLSLGAALGFGFAGTVANRFGVKRVVLIATIALQASIWGMLLAPPPMLLAAYALFGVSGGFNLLLLTQARFVAPMSHVGRAVTFVNLAGIGGGFLLQWLLGVVLSLFGQGADGAYPQVAYVVSLGGASVGLLLTSLWYFAAYPKDRVIR